MKRQATPPPKNHIVRIAEPRWQQIASVIIIALAVGVWLFFLLDKAVK
jgi:hypothetical protein